MEFNNNAQDAVAMTDANEQLKRLERQDWWRWATVVSVTLLLTFGVFALSLPELKRGFMDQARLDLSVTALCGIVLLFDVFALYQQVIIMRLRRQLANQIGMMTTLEMLKPVAPASPGPRPPVREFQRFHFDQRVTVKADVENKQVTTHGRTSDISDRGVGTVIPEPLQLGTHATVEINLGGDSKLVIPSVLRYRRGFHHGFEFLGVTPSQVDTIHRACEGALPFFDFREPAPGSPSTATRHK
jgi:hypothetical protein